MPGALRRWLLATGLFEAVSDETHLLLRKGLPHAYHLDPGPTREVVALVALEMFRCPRSRWRRARDLVMALVPNHWVVLRSPVTIVAPGRVGMRLWSWGSEYAVEMDASRLRRCYFGALVAGVTK